MHSSGGCFHQTMNLLPRYPEKKESLNRHFVTGGIKPERKAMLLLVRMLFRSTQDKFLVVVETASMNETELAEYARKKDLYIEQIKAWKDACMNANGGIAKEASRLNRELKDSEKERRKLEKELQRKEKALAEAAALLVLSKKANAIWGDSEDE